MRIVHVMNWYIPNMGYQENYLPLEQKKFGHDVIIITSDRLPLHRGINDNSRQLKPGKYSDNDVDIYRLSVLFEYEKSGVLILKGLKKLLRELKPVIVHLHGTFLPMAIQAIHYQKSMKYKLFIDDHSHKGNFGINTIYKKLYVKIISKYYDKNKKRINCLLPVQYSSKEVLKKYLPDFNMELLHLGANDIIFKPSIQARKTIRKQYYINDDEILIITSGKFDKNKDIDILMRAFKNIYKKDKYKLIIIGNGPKEYVDYLKELSKEFISNKIIFIDFLKNHELNKYYNAADIGVWPGDHSIGIIEAVSSGLPVIIPGNDLAYKVLFDNNAAIGFERKNIKSLLKSIYLLSNKDERDKIRKNGLLLISKELNWDTIAKKSIEIYKNY